LATQPRIEINANPDIRVEEVGDGDYCIIVDDFLQNPHDIAAFAVENADLFETPERSYPGLLFDVKQEAMSEVSRFIRSRMSSHFAFLRGGLETSTFLSMVTAQPNELSNLQRLCHMDPRGKPDRRNFAALIYLFENEALGGTGFFRWRNRKLVEEATALEHESPEKALTFLRDNFETYNQPACYMTESNEIAELVYAVPARFNRFIFYSGDLPHSARIASPELLSDDFRRGRLTLNCFVSVRPR
jgi:hypothetical protein